MFRNQIGTTAGDTGGCFYKNVSEKDYSLNDVVENSILLIKQKNYTWGFYCHKKGTKEV